ncbi:hypothetical protein FM038_017270 [Shewanella eurypsychrophilus]|uniref:Lipoprotein n=1 Tax=Shewanella eurypsychrophilus TaxID=2593656 RepID=A0ABX6VAQ7_9GAMM|nr:MULTISPECIES: hypothetical protein [Shewanella]QFU23748.1 hypothetical protein FS418_19050 [Shewanella sp. YLB-09]QPG58971.1 hypothetical protein FM038_017270 [Shewanella eurypsychrophilus]
MKTFISLMLAICFSACASYEFGDISRVYCGTTSSEARAQIKAKMKDNGLSIGIDYCASAGLVDALLEHHPEN